MLMLVGKKRDAEQFHGIVGVALHHLASGLIDKQRDLMMTDGFAVEQNLKVELVRRTGNGNQSEKN